MQNTTHEVFRTKQPEFTVERLCELASQIEDVFSNNGFIGVCDASWIKTGKAGFCAVLVDNDTQITEHAITLDNIKSNNDAEYEALTSLVQMAIKTNESCLLFSDSLTQIEKVQADNILPGHIQLRWLPRKMIGPANAKARNVLGLSWNKHACNWSNWINELRSPV